MDNRLILTVLFVTLSWMSVGTYAQNATSAQINGTSTPNVTTVSGNNTSVTTVAGNITGATTVAGNITGATTVAGNINGATTVAGNITGATTVARNITGATTVAGNITGATTVAGNITGATTVAGNTTTAVTAAPPLTPNTTVEALQTPLSRAECGTQQLCAAEPSNCNPSSGSCFFLAAKRQSGQNFEFGLSGESQGYIAATLSPDSTLGGNDTTYVCARNNGVVKFFSTVLNNDQLIQQELNVNSVKGRVNGTTIQCTFAATVPIPATRADTFVLAVSTGSFNSTTGTLGTPSNKLKSNLVDLGNPSATVTNQITPNTTTSPSTTTPNHAITLQQSLMQALLITVGVLGLAML